MEKEFKSLSEKRIGQLNNQEVGVFYYPEKNIKEFIKRLKAKRVCVNGVKNSYVVYWDDIEDEAGPKLITKS